LTTGAKRSAALQQDINPRRIALFGGSFDPNPQRSSRPVATRQRIARFNFDEIHFIPAQPPRRTN